jgi:hypothetical protein
MERLSKRHVGFLVLLREDYMWPIWSVKTNSPTVGAVSDRPSFVSIRDDSNLQRKTGGRRPPLQLGEGASKKFGKNCKVLTLSSVM